MARVAMARQASELRERRKPGWRISEWSSTLLFTFIETMGKLQSTCGGEAPMTAYYAAIVTLLVSLATIAIAFLVSSKRFPAVSAVAATSTVYRIRSVYFVIILAVTIIGLAFTLPMTPYPSKSDESRPDLTVKALGEMWSWTLTPSPGDASAKGNLTLPAGKAVEFEVSSKDVNHNFAIYNSAGELIAQVQAMPNYTNHLFYRFDVPGHYYVLCLEYCGVAHHAMNAEFDVK
jgi:cytochrome c oxidase subunit 2